MKQELRNWYAFLGGVDFRKGHPGGLSTKQTCKESFDQP